MNLLSYGFCRLNYMILTPIAIVELIVLLVTGQKILKVAQHDIDSSNWKKQTEKYYPDMGILQVKIWETPRDYVNGWHAQLFITLRLKKKERKSCRIQYWIQSTSKHSKNWDCCQKKSIISCPMVIDVAAKDDAKVINPWIKKIPIKGIPKNIFKNLFIGICDTKNCS